MSDPASLENTARLLSAGGAWRTGKWVGFLSAKDAERKEHGTPSRCAEPTREGQALFRA